MNNPHSLLNCPHCNVSLLGESIPAEHLHYYRDGATHFKREIGIEYPKLYDGVWEWKCPDCLNVWPSEAQKATMRHIKLKESK